MDVQIKMQYVLRLEADEWRLIVAALHENLSEEQRQAALELQKKMVETKEIALNQALKQTQNTLKNIKGEK